MALKGKGILKQDVAIIEAAEAIYRDVLSVTGRTASPLHWTSASKDIATIQFMLGTTRMDKAQVEEAIRTFDAAPAVYGGAWRLHGPHDDRRQAQQRREGAGPVQVIRRLPSWAA